MKINQEIEEFQNWLWGIASHEEFMQKYNNPPYRAIAFIAGVSLATVQHWFCDASSPHHRIPSARCLRMLNLADFLLSTFNMAPEDLIAYFQKSRT